MSEGWNSSEILVHRRDDGYLEADQTTIDLLNAINAPVQVVAMVGPFRTGKSHLLNSFIKKLSGREDDVFPVGDTVEAATRGISIWCCPHPSCQGLWLIFLDMEGLSDVKKGDRENDLHIFVLSVLLSSTLIYNSRGTIDMQALEMLHHVSCLADRIRVMPEADEDFKDIGLDLAFPEFIWVVRDFQLSLEKNGRRITDDDYLESSLSNSKTGLGRKEANLISIKRSIRENFPKRKCFLFPNLRQLENTSDKTKSKFASLIDHILSGNCKVHEGSEVTGRVFGQLTKELVFAVQNSEGPIDVQCIMTDIARKENVAAMAKSFEHYRTHFTSYTTEPVDEVTLHQIHLRCSEEAMILYSQSAIYPCDNGLVELMNSIKQEFSEASELNSTKIREFCDKTFKSLRQEVIGSSNSKYFCLGGFQRYREDMTEIRKRWEMFPVLQGTMGRNYFMEKLKKLKEEEADMIMNADREMTALKREEAAKRHEKERLELEAIRKKAENTVRQDRDDFQQKIEGQVQGCILRPQEAEISKLNLRIQVLEQELNDLRAKTSSTSEENEEVETCEYRLKMYRKILQEKRNEPSRWQKVSSSIRSFATDTYDSVCRFLRRPELARALSTTASVVVTALSSVHPVALSARAMLVDVGTRALATTLQPSEQKGQRNESQQNQDQQNQGQWNQCQPNQGQQNQGQWNQGQPNQDQWNQGQPNQGQWNQGQWNQGQWNH